nr:hypothetical protein [Tanacetum cinerariifolium]
MGYEHLSINPETESDEVIESNAENLLPIPSECEVALEYKRECDVPISENSPVCDNHSDIFSDSKIDDDISVYDDDFENIKYVEVSLSDPEIVSVEEENVVQQEEEEVDFEDISQIQDVVLQPPDDKSDLEPEVISAVMENIDKPNKDESFDPGGEIFVSTNDEDVDHFPFMFVIRIFLPYLILPEISPLFLSVESEDTIFDPGISD